MANKLKAYVQESHYRELVIEGLVAISEGESRARSRPPAGFPALRWMARRKKHEEHENHERWLVSYADFITLLFAFCRHVRVSSVNEGQVPCCRRR